MGSEGCGVVVALGGGLATYAAGVKVGSKVGFVKLPFRQGAYSEYVVADVVGGVFPMPDDLPVESAASFFTNPYTAIAIIDTVKKEGASAFVHTAAASQLGQMIARLAPSEGIEVIHVVRRDEQAQLLRDIGANHIVVSGTDADADDSAWKKELRSKVDELGATVAFDAVSGASTGDMLDALPRKGTTYLYGGLAGRAANIDPMHLIYSQKKLKGFLVTNWIKEGGLIAMGRRILAAAKRVNEGLGEGGWSCSQFLDTTMECAQEDLVALLGSGKSTGKKLRIRFDKA